MKNAEQKLWPFGTRKSLLATMLAFIILITSFVVLKTTFAWPGENLETLVLIGIMLLSLVPIALALFDILVARGGSVEYKGLKIDFAQASGISTSGFKVPDNIGVPGLGVTDSGTTAILETLTKATSSEMILIDLKEGQAWWETRLLVLLAGAIRHEKPEKVIFVGTEGKVENKFLGWAYPSELFPLLLRTDGMYQRIYYKTLAVSMQWSLVEPINEKTGNPKKKAFMSANAYKKYWLPFDYNSGLPNVLFTEQLLASELEEEIENKIKIPRRIGLTKLNELFKSVLRMDLIDESWQSQKQIDSFLESDADYLGVTQKGKYKALVSRLRLLNEAVKSLINQ